MPLDTHIISGTVKSFLSSQPLHACGTNSLKRQLVTPPLKCLAGWLVFRLFCLATMVQFEAVSQMRLHTGMSPWRSASGFFCRCDPWSNERTYIASVGSLSRDEPGGATQAKSAAGARLVKHGEAESGWRVIDRTFKIKASFETPVGEMGEKEKCMLIKLTALIVI